MSRKKVLMSASAAAVVASAFVATEDVSAATHKVSTGDSLWKIAQANNVSVSNLKKWNNLQHDLIFPNQVIQVMKPSGGSNSSSSSSSSSSNNNSSSSSAGGSYTVKSGDTLSGIAFDNGVSLKNLMSWNNLNSTLIHPGNKLSLKNGSSSSGSSSSSNSSSNSSGSSSSSNSNYVVKSGDTLSHIAADHGTSASKIADLNGMKLSDIIHVGDKLKVSGTASNDSSGSSSGSSSSDSGSSSSKTTTYVVKSGDSLSQIASTHGTTAQKIASLSGINTSDIIHIGDKLTVSGKASSSGSSSGSSGSSDTGSKPSANSGFSANQLMNSAKSVIGTKYVWGGSTKSGFDCSGFIHWAYNDAGKEMGRTSTDGYYSRSFDIKRSELQIGDLIFFSGTYRPGISHMGIYAGNNEFIHAGSSNGVTVSSLDSSYWTKHFDSYKRFY